MRQVESKAMKNMYREMGISEAVLDFSNDILAGLKERFEKIDEVAEYNQMKVLHAMQENQVSEMHLETSSGYGYTDLGRDTLESVYADVFHTEDALVRTQIACGTHALNIALSIDDSTTLNNISADSFNLNEIVQNQDCRDTVLHSLVLSETIKNKIFKFQPTLALMRLYQLYKVILSLYPPRQVFKIKF